MLKLIKLADDVDNYVCGTKGSPIMRLQGKTALITGASQGVGAAVALACAREGASVVLASRNINEQDDVVQQLQAMGKDFLFRRTDVGDSIQVRTLVKDALTAFDKIDAKGAVHALTKSAAKELARYNIRVNNIAPMAMTDMTRVIFEDPRFKDKYLQRIAMGRFAMPQEIAPAVIFLASDDSSYITGQTICVDGGMVMR